MRIINQSRGSGKTTDLIVASHVTGIPIVVQSQKSLERVRRLSEENRYANAQVYTVSQVRDYGRSLFPHGSYVLLDDCECILQEALNEYFGCNIQVAAMTMSLPMEEKSMNTNTNKEEE